MKVVQNHLPYVSHEMTGTKKQHGEVVEKWHFQYFASIMSNAENFISSSTALCRGGSEL